MAPMIRSPASTAAVNQAELFQRRRKTSLIL